MGWTAPRDWTVGEVVTEAMMDTHVKDNLNYLKGVGQVPTIQSGLTIDNSLGSERLLLPLLSTAECTTVLNAEGEVAFDETTHQMKEYDGTAVRVLISEADVDDTPVNGATTVPVSSNWAYDFINILTTQGDLPYATAAGAWTRLAKGTAGQTLRMNVGATAPEWSTPAPTMEFYVPPLMGSGCVLAAVGDYAVYDINSAGDSVRFSFRVPNDFVTLTSVKVLLIPIATGTFDWTVTTDFGASGEAYNADSDSATADAQAATNNQILELDISAAYTGLAANDNVGTAFTIDTLTTTTNVEVIGLNVKYT